MRNRSKSQPQQQRKSAEGKANARRSKSRDLSKEQPIKGTLASLRQLFATEAQMYYSQFPETIYRVCYALLFVIGICVIRMALMSVCIYFTVKFNNKVLVYLDKAYDKLYEEDNTLPVIASSIVNLLNGAIVFTIAMCSLSILVDIGVVITSSLRHVRSVGLFMAIGTFVHFWTMMVMTFVILAGFSSEQVIGTIWGNFASRDFDLNPNGHYIHLLQQKFKCCGMTNGPIDWKKEYMYSWVEADAIHRHVINRDRWIETCSLEASVFTCVAPLSCCKNMYNGDAMGCNRGNLSDQEYTQKVTKDVSAAHRFIAPQHPEKMYMEGCITKLAEEFELYTRILLGLCLSLILSWAIIVVFVSLIVAEVSGIGSVDPRTQLVDPTTVRNIVPFGSLNDTCCGDNGWAVMDELSEKEAVKEDKLAIERIEEGKPLDEADLTGNTNDMMLFLPDLKEVRALTDTTESV